MRATAYVSLTTDIFFNLLKIFFNLFFIFNLLKIYFFNLLKKSTKICPCLMEQFAFDHNLVTKSTPLDSL